MENTIKVIESMTKELKKLRVNGNCTASDLYYYHDEIERIIKDYNEMKPHYEEEE